MVGATPTYVLAGAMRSGTTSLNTYLRAHPAVAVSQPKEVHFFDFHFDKGLEWYRSHFPRLEGESSVGEATPSYMYHPLAMERVAATLPGIKVIVLLRNPIDRAYSHYWHNRSRNREHLSFQDAIAAEPERIARDAHSRHMFSYVDRGRYRHQIKRLLTHIPRQQVLVHTFDAFKDDPAGVFANVCRFLGIDEAYRPEQLGRAINGYVEFRSVRLRDAVRGLPLPRRVGNLVGRLNRRPASSYPALGASTREDLAVVFREANDGLEELLGQSVPIWT